MRTTQEIYEEMLAVYAQERGEPLTQDCDLSVRLWAAAAQIQALEMQAEWVLRQSFPQTASGEYLDRHAASRAISRASAARASGTLTFTAASAPSGEITIPSGTTCMTRAGIRFETTEDATIGSGETSASAAARAAEAGSTGNVPAGAVRVLTACPVAVTGVTNDAAFAGGCDAEDDEALRKRVLETFLRLPNGTNAAWYEQTARGVPPVAAAKAIGRARGVGTVDVYVSTAEGVPSAEVLAQLQAIFDERREIAVDVKVKAPSTNAVNVSVSVKTAEGASFAQVSEAVSAAVTGFFDGQLLGKGVLLAALSERIYALEGVANVHIASPAADVAAAETTLPVLGTLTVTEEA
ncbi:MAG: baseplate J/gp47 family protein [Oscillibacter sp.]|nr:baseplate J/gp47 family protein [Oscillibacter sp.]